MTLILTSNANPNPNPKPLSLILNPLSKERWRFCSSHIEGDNKLDFRCMTCSDIVCSECLLRGPHLGHIACPLVDAFEVEKKKMKHHADELASQAPLKLMWRAFCFTWKTYIGACTTNKHTHTHTIQTVNSMRILVRMYCRIPAPRATPRHPLPLTPTLIRSGF